MNRSDLQTLASLRLTEARALLSGGHSSGAYYLAGYAVECALKAVIAKQTQQYEFPDKQRANDSYVHDLKRLLNVAKLNKSFDVEANPQIVRNWGIVVEWSENSRYLISDEVAAESMLVAVGDQIYGVLPWITQYW